ncbi:MAG: tetratricopeptide repeat protein [Candidatus Hermodarchaeota archaeon]
MSEKKLIKPYEKSVENLIFSENRYIFMVGAGISIDPPANLLPAPQFIQYLLELCAPIEEIQNLLSLKTLRYEMIVELIQRYIDYGLEFMDYFEFGTEPNLIHLFLAQAIMKGHAVYTTNFDYLIEYGLQKLLPDDKKSHILPVITKHDFINNQNPNESFSDGNFPIYKLHGAKKNVITNIKTTDSLMTTMSAFGKGDVVLSLEPHKKNSFKEISKNETIIIMGYSGSDDFDIAPVLRTLFDIKSLIWIDHHKKDSFEIYEFDPKAAFVIPKGLNRTERLLAEISSNTEAQVIMIKTNTSKFIEEKLWALLFDKEQIPKIDKSKTSKVPQFQDWINKKFPNVPEVLKWKSTADLYLELGFKDDFYRCSQKGLKIAQEIKSKKMEAEFQNLMGVYHYNEKAFDEALSFFEKALEINKEMGNQQLQGSRINNIGLIHLEKGNYEEAMKLFEEAFKIAQGRGDYHGMATRLNNMGLVYLKQEDYEKAIEKLKEALKYDKKSGNLAGHVIRLTNIGDTYKSQQKFPEALENYRNAYQIVQKLSDRIKMGKLLIELGKTHADMNDLGKAITNLRKAIDILKDTGDKVSLFEAEETLKGVKKLLK